MQRLAQQTVKSVFWVGSTQAIGQLISSLVVTIYLMRILSPVDYGLVGMALSYQAILFILYDLGIGVAIVQKQNLTEEDAHSAFWFSTIVGIVLFALSWYLAIFVGAFYSDDRLVWLVRVLSIGNIFLAIKEVPYCIMAKHLEFKRRGLAELIAGILCLAISLVLAINGFGPWSLIIGQVSREFLLMALIMFLSKWKIRILFQISNIKPLLRFGLPITGQSLLNYANVCSDSIIIGKFLGKHSLGYYQTAMSLANYPIQKVIVIANKVIFPVFAKLQDDEERMKTYFYKMFHLITLFSFPIFFGLFCVSREVIVLVLDPKWLPGLFVLRVFCFIAIFRSYIGFLLIILKAKGNAAAVFRYSLYSSILLPAAFLIGVSHGISGVALAWLYCFPALFIYLLWLVKKEINISFLATLKKTHHVFFASLLMLLLIMPLKNLLSIHHSISFFGLAAIVLTGTIIFVGYNILFNRRIFTELKEIGVNLVS